MLWVTLLQKMERRLPECPSENLKFMGMHSRRDLWTLSHSEMAAVMLWPQLPRCWLCMRFVVLPSQCPRPALDVAYSERLLKDLWSSYHPIRFKKKIQLLILNEQTRAEAWGGSVWSACPLLFPWVFNPVFRKPQEASFYQKVSPIRVMGWGWGYKKTNENSKLLRKGLNYNLFKVLLEWWKPWENFPSLKWK